MTRQLARVDVVMAAPTPRFAVWCWSRRDYLRVLGKPHDWPTEERARALLRTEGLVETTDPTVPRGACVAMFPAAGWAP